MRVVPGLERIPVSLVPQAPAELRYFDVMLPLLPPAVAHVLLLIEPRLSTRNIPTAGQFRVYVPAPGNSLCFLGTSHVRWGSFAVVSPDSPDQRACQQCPNGHRVPEKLTRPVHTMSVRQQGHSDRGQYPLDNSATRRPLRDLLSLRKLLNTPSAKSGRRHSHPAI